jgi:outer membrane protein OmpA-like peptidoglycan-associated protein
MISLQKFNLPLEYGIFALSKEQDCSAIHLGEATLLTNEYLEEAINRKEIDSIPYSKNQVLFFFINTTSSVKNEIAVQAIFKEEVSDEEFHSMKKTFDFRATEKEAPFTIMIRDAKTKLPVVANVIVSESRTHNALYTASDMLFPYSDNLKMTLNVDASGYFFQDVLINTRKEENEELTIFLEALEQDQLIELEGLVFVMQSDVLVPEALPKLKRLKDFMVINTRVNIEIQGHVHLDGKNTFKAKRLSKKRAKTVKAFLVESGIDKKRISVVGYGNSKMIYPEAFSDAEKQANRRVEIKIK